MSKPPIPTGPRVPPPTIAGGAVRPAAKHGKDDVRPPSPIFDALDRDQRLGPDTLARESERERLAEMRKALPGMLQEAVRRPRIQQFLPHLLVRQYVGDLGNRPIAAPTQDSPDIWVWVGHPNAAPDIPPAGRGDSNLVHTQTITVYAHVWNLGRAPVAGATVEFYWAWSAQPASTLNPTRVVEPATHTLIGIARVDLGPRSSSACHKLVKCPKPLLVHENHAVARAKMLYVRVSGIGDPCKSDSWICGLDRHVAERVFLP